VIGLIRRHRRKQRNHMSEKKPGPMSTDRQRALCPVCGKASYSPTGEHPQCALARADAVSRADRKAAEVETKKPVVRKSWVKTCPKCKRETPARRFVCDCGHQFTPIPARPAKSAC
jgi:hypothetical protein